LKVLNNKYKHIIKKIKHNKMKKLILLAATVFIGFASYAEDTTAETPTNNATTTETTEAAIINNDEVYVYERRFSAITEIGTTFAQTQPYFNIYQVIGVRVNPYFFIGQGFGLQVSNNKLLQIQATADVRAYVLDKKDHFHGF
jgi:hypothetical protein